MHNSATESKVPEPKEPFETICPEGRTRTARACTSVIIGTAEVQAENFSVFDKYKAVASTPNGIRPSAGGLSGSLGRFE